MNDFVIFRIRKRTFTETENFLGETSTNFRRAGSTHFCTHTRLSHWHTYTRTPTHTLITQAHAHHTHALSHVLRIFVYHRIPFGFIWRSCYPPSLPVLPKPRTLNSWLKYWYMNACTSVWRVRVWVSECVGEGVCVWAGSFCVIHLLPARSVQFLPPLNENHLYEMRHGARGQIRCYFLQVSPVIRITIYNLLKTSHSISVQVAQLTSWWLVSGIK